MGLTKAELEQEPKSGPGAGGDSLQLIKNDIKEALKGRGQELLRPEIKLPSI